MKKLLLLLTLIICSQSADAQLFNKERLNNFGNGGKGDYDQRFLTWGYFLGFNSYDFKIEYKEQFEDDNTDILVDEEVGFNVGLVGDMRITDNIHLRLEPGLYYTKRDLYYTSLADEEENVFLRETKSTYIHVPLLIKLATDRINNFRPFIVGGISSSINLSSNQDNPEDNSVGQFRMQSSTAYFELGFGVDFYLYYFKFTPSIRGVFATTDELQPDDDPNSPWTGNIDALKTRGIFLNFTFQ